MERGHNMLDTNADVGGYMGELIKGMGKGGLCSVGPLMEMRQCYLKRQR